MLLQIEVITVCNETKQHILDETSNNDLQENPAPPKMSEEEKKKRLKDSKNVMSCKISWR